MTDDIAPLLPLPRTLTLDEFREQVKAMAELMASPGEEGDDGAPFPGRVVAGALLSVVELSRLVRCCGCQCAMDPEQDAAQLLPFPQLQRREP